MPILFLIILLGVYLLSCAYVFVRSVQALPRILWLRVAWLVCLAFAAAGFFAGVAFRETRLAGLPLGYWLRTLGVTWMISLPYWVIAALFWDAVRLAGKRWRFLPAWAGARGTRARLLALAATIALVAGVFVLGYINFTHPKTTALHVRISKAPGGGFAASGKTLRLAVASDLHLGDIIGRNRLRDYVARINALRPDIILLPGDIIDRSVEPLEKQNMGALLEELRAPLGVFAVVGNHENHANVRRSLDFLRKHNIRVLYDEVIPVAEGAFLLAGRADHSLPRKPLDEILAGIDRARPLILMDHQPRALDRSAAAGVDLQFSGHTHAGQIWPVTWLIPFLYEIPHGYARKGAFQIYVTSGLGLWGFPARIGSSSEIVDVTVEFAK